MALVVVEEWGWVMGQVGEIGNGIVADCGRMLMGRGLGRAMSPLWNFCAEWTHIY